MRDRGVEEVMTWFGHCYDLEVDPNSSAPYFRRVALPGAGGIGDQDARLIYGMATIAEMEQRALEDDVRERRREQERATDGE